MHCTGVKTIDDKRAKICNSYKNTKLKLLKTNAVIWFNKIYKTKQMTPNYFSIKFDGVCKILNYIINNCADIFV